MKLKFNNAAAVEERQRQLDISGESEYRTPSVSKSGLLSYLACHDGQADAVLQECRHHLCVQAQGTTPAMSTSGDDDEREEVRRRCMDAPLQLFDWHLLTSWFSDRSRAEALAPR